MNPGNAQTEMPIVRDRREFDVDSGMRLERLVFNHRRWVMLLCVLLTAFLGWHASKLQVNASFDKMIPQSHPYIKNYLANRELLPGAGNVIRIAVAAQQGDIYDAAYLLKLQQINDTLFLMPGIDRSWLRSLWTSSLRWTEVTEEGFRGGPVMPDPFDGSPQAMEQLRINVARAGIVGSHVAADAQSSMIVAPLLEIDPATQQPLDYALFSRELESKIRGLQDERVQIHIVGFAKIVGDLIDGLLVIQFYFLASALIASLLVYLYTRCLRSTAILVASALLGVVWLLGIVQLLGYSLNPYLILVPFLVFAIGLSHGAQKMNGIMQDIARGCDRYVAARYTFRRLFMAGLTALLTNIVGFAVLMVIDIPVIRDMALITSLGVTVLVFTKLILIPVLLSYVGVSKVAAARNAQSLKPTAQNRDGLAQRVQERLVRLTERGPAIAILLAAAAVATTAIVIGREVKFGDLDRGAPELRADSRYNRDSAYITDHYSLSDDQFIVMLKTPLGECGRYASLVEADRLGAVLRQVPGVQTTYSMADGVRLMNSGLFEGNARQMSIPRNGSTLNQAVVSFSGDRPDLVDRGCSLLPIIAFLDDHRAETLDRVVAASEAFAQQHSTDARQFQLAAGNSGIEAATNIVVRQSFWTMHFVLYGAVVLLCFITFRSGRAVLVAIIPLILTSLLCEALMVVLGIGIKVATLPVIAVGVGVGVDYALYLLSIQLAHQRAGASLADSYRASLQFTGKVVALVGITMAAGVITWALSPIKFQADMGLLLTFMFLWNMLGALTLIPALSHFLLPRLAAR